jgi:pimeloyl-ACP methyl ester carboxylesterase
MKYEYRMFKSVLASIVMLMICASVFYVSLSFAEDVYIPEPLILVHGMGPGSPSAWKNIRTFVEENELLSGKKYFDIPDNKLFRVVDYGATSSLKLHNGRVQWIGRYVSDEIESVLNHPSLNGRKVNIIAHSMGTLATRWAYDELKVDRIVFIGGPHLGSPLASALWLLNEVVQRSARDEAQKMSFVSFGQQPRWFYQNGFYYDSYGQALRKTKFNIAAFQKILQYSLLNFSKNVVKIDPAGGAVYDMRVPLGEVTFDAIFKTYIDTGQIYETTILSKHEANETYLGSTTDLAWPDNAVVMVGDAGKVKDDNLVGKLSNFTAKILTGWMNCYGKFNFPLGHTLQDLYFPFGDEIVTVISQANGIDADYVLHENHSGETNATKAIIHAIDDIPKVKRIRVIDAPPYARRSTYNSFVMVKTEEYFLADLKIEKLTLDGADVTHKYLSEMADVSKDKKIIYLPYKQFGKEFLRKRQFVYQHNQIRDYDLSDTFILDPGEFYIYLTDLSHDKAHTVSITFKNPAGKTTDVSFKFSRPIIKNVKMETMVNEEGILCPKSICVRDPRIDPMPTTGGHGENCESPYDTVSILECEVHDPLFSNVKLDFEVHNFRLGNHRKSRLVKTLATRNVKSGQVIKNPCVWDGTDSRGYRGYYGTDLFIRGFGLSGISNDQPAFALTGDDLSGDCGALTVMGTNFDDENRGDYQLRSFKCDPSFLQPPREFVPQTIQVPYGDARKEEFDAYLVSLGVKQTKEEKKESITPAMHGDRDNVRLSINYQAPLFTLCVATQ